MAGREHSPCNLLGLTTPSLPQENKTHNTTAFGTEEPDGESETPETDIPDG